MSDSTRRSADIPTCVISQTLRTFAELLQPLDLDCRTLFRSSCAIQTSPTNCSDDSWRDNFFGKHITALCDFWYAAPKKNTYLLTYVQPPTEVPIKIALDIIIFLSPNRTHTTGQLPTRWHDTDTNFTENADGNRRRENATYSVLPECLPWKADAWWGEPVCRTVPSASSRCWPWNWALASALY